MLLHLLICLSVGSVFFFFPVGRKKGLFKLSRLFLGGGVSRENSKKKWGEPANFKDIDCGGKDPVSWNSLGVRIVGGGYMTQDSLRS